MSEFRVTEKSMRPASDMKQCFYCQKQIDDYHSDNCVLIQKKVKIRFEVEYEVSAPFNWDKDLIEFRRNEGSWCTDNVLDELTELSKQDGCLCATNAEFTYIEDTSTAFLDE